MALGPDSAARASLLFAFFFVTTLALIRPPFQLSDEVYYFAMVQPVERVNDTRPSCQAISIRVMPIDTDRPLFRWLVTPLLYQACQVTGSPATAFHVTRAVLGLGFLIIVWATWLAGRMLAPGTPAVAAIAASMTASHPVLATMSAGITPSAVSDPLAALACLGLVGATTAEGGRRFAWLGVAVSTSILAMLAKDSAIGLAAIVIVGGPLLTVQPSNTHSVRGPRRLRLLIGVALVATLAALTALAAIVSFGGGSFQVYRRSLEVESAADRIFQADVLIRTVSSLPQYYWSYIGNLGNFGGNSVQLPGALGWVVLALAITAGLGLARHRNARGRVKAWSWRRLTFLFAVLTVVLLLQAPVRDAMAGLTPGLQGRWLFPAVVPFTLWTGLGLLAWTPRVAHLVPLVSTVIATVPCVALFWVIVPHFYAAFPHIYNFQGLFLRGPNGVPVDQALLAPFLGPPAWLADMRVAWLLLLATLLSAVWMVIAISRQAEVGGSAR